ncbi:MAG: substrate-binding domain-containing protein [Actinomycetota bacterium]|nr:substrate-binding domain-containing protein [Actinomycetota bacterium]
MNISALSRGAVASAVLGLTLAACGSSASSSTSSTTATTSSGNAAAVAAAASYVQSLEQRPTTFSVPSLPSKPPTGKSIDFMACGVPVCQSFANVVKDAAAAVGWSVKVVQLGGTPQTVAAGYDQAVRDNPAGVIGSGGFPPSLMSNQLQQLAAEHVPVVLVDVASPGNAAGAILTSATQAEYGKEIGSWILANSKGKNAHVAIMTSPATPIYSATHQAIQQALSSCVSCSVSTYSFPFTAIGTTLPTNVVTYLTSHPSVNYLFFDFSNEADGVPAALQAAGLAGKVKIATTDTTSTETGYLKAGQESVAAAIPWPEMLWGAVNVVLRANMNLPLGPGLSVTFPTMLFTGSNVLQGSGSEPPALVANFQSIYKTAWHVG